MLLFMRLFSRVSPHNSTKKFYLKESIEFDNLIAQKYAAGIIDS